MNTSEDKKTPRALRLDEVPGFEWADNGKAGYSQRGWGCLTYRGETVIGSCTEFAARCYATGFAEGCSATTGS